MAKLKGLPSNTWSANSSSRNVSCNSSNTWSAKPSDLNYFTCGDPWVPGHGKVCKGRKEALHMLGDAELEEEEPKVGDEDVEEVVHNHVELSMHAINGSLGSRTLKLRGKIKSRPILILLDTGSTATFINLKLVKDLQLNMLQTSCMTISLADGSRVSCSLICPKVVWEMSGSRFKFDCKILELGTYDPVLGTDWMQGCNPILFDFVMDEATIRSNGKEITLNGNRSVGSDNVVEISSLSITSLNQGNTRIRFKR